MKTFDFNNPEIWHLAALVYLDTSDEDYIDYMFQDLEEWNGVQAKTTPFWDWKETDNNATEDSRFALKGTCDHCGAHFKYGAAYMNEVGEFAIVGNICASNKLNLTAHEYADAKLRKAVKAAKSRAKADKVLAALLPNRLEVLNTDHYIINSIRGNLRKYHSLSLKQWALIKKIAGEEKAKAEAKANEPTPEPVIEGKGIVIEGVLLGTRSEPGYGYNQYVTKMLVRDDRNFKVWGTYPTFADQNYPQPGDRIRFTANVEASDNDECFGFFKRPRLAVALTTEETQ